MPVNHLISLAERGGAKAVFNYLHEIDMEACWRDRVRIGDRIDSYVKNPSLFSSHEDFPEVIKIVSDVFHHWNWYTG